MKFTGAEEVDSFLQAMGKQADRDLTGQEKAVHFRPADGGRVAAFRRPGTPHPLVCISK